MAKNTKIEWTDHTFNPWIGCSKVSPGCENCYAEGESKRRGWALWGKGQPRQKTKTWHAPEKWNREAMESGKRRRVFCASLADVFDDEIDPQWRDELWELIRKTPFLDWLLLTKRPKNIRKMLPDDWGNGWPNACLMTSVEDQLRTNRIPELLKVPAAYYGLSMEPLLGPVIIKPEWLQKLNWIIVGGESGRNARPMHPEWVRLIRQQCKGAEVQFFFKQWGCWSPEAKFLGKSAQNVTCFAPHSTRSVMIENRPIAERRALINDPGEMLLMYRGDKKETGHMLDGKSYREHPFGRSIPKLDIIEPLTAEERKRLQVCETTIHKGLGTFVEVGNALMEIRDSRLYRVAHPTFEIYVQRVLALSRPRAYELIDGAQVMRDLSAIADISLPQNEGQARELRRLKSPEERCEKWKEVVAAAGKDNALTAKFIRQTINPSGPALARESDAAKIQICLNKLRALFKGSSNQAEALRLIARLEKVESPRAENGT